MLRHNPIPQSVGRASTAKAHQDLILAQQRVACYYRLYSLVAFLLSPFLSSRTDLHHIIQRFYDLNPNLNRIKGRKTVKTLFWTSLPQPQAGRETSLELSLNEPHKCISSNYSHKMEAAFPRGKIATDGAKPSRGRSAGAERLFGAKPAVEAEARRERSESKKRSKSRGGSGKSGRSGSKGASGGSKDHDFAPVASDNHTVRRADELSFKVSYAN